MSSIVLPPAVPRPNQDCLDLHRAFKGLGCDADTVIRILAHRNDSHRSQIRVVYKNMFEEDICKRLKHELHHNFKKAMLMWMSDAPVRDAMILCGALKNSNGQQRSRVLAEVLSLQSTHGIVSMTKAYHSLYGRPLQNDMEASLSSSCQKLFVQYLCVDRDESTDLEPHFASEEAKKLHHALSTHLDEASIIYVLTSRNRQQLCRIFDAYRDMYKSDIYKVIKQWDKTTKNEFNRAVRIITKCVSNPEEYFAKVLYKSMKGLGTDNDTLIRVIVTHAEVDLANIKVAFLQQYRKPLAAMVHADTSNNYRKFLLALIGAPY